MSKQSRDRRYDATRINDPARKLYKTSRWLKLRDWQLRNHPLCKMCESEGRITEATICDHVIPHRGDVSKFWSEVQSLCKAHHDGTKRAEEQGWDMGCDEHGRPLSPAHPWNYGNSGVKWGYSIPWGLKPSAIPVEIICGPPGSGKSTFARQNWREGDILIDFDDCRMQVGGKIRDTRREIVKAAFKHRDSLLHSLSKAKTGKAWFIVDAPSADERDQWAKALGPKAHLTVLKTPSEVCIARIDADPDRLAVAGLLKSKAAHWWGQQADRPRAS